MNEEVPDGGAESPGSVGRIRYRASWRQILPLGVAFGIMALTQWSNLAMSAHAHGGMPGVPLESRTLAVGLPIVLAVELWMLGHHFGISLTPEAAVVHNMRRRTIPWTDVAEVAVEPITGGRRVVLYEWDGRRTPLRMPSSAFLSRDPRFDEKAATIRSWWLANGGTAQGTDTTGEPDAGENAYQRLPERLGMRPALNRSGPGILLLVLVAADAVLAGYAGGGDQPTVLSRVLGVLVAISLLLGAGFLGFGRGVVLTADQLTIRGLRPRTVPWDDVQGIVVEPHGGGRRVIVVETNGARTPLPVPRVGRVLWDPEFEADVQTLRHWWHTHARTDASPTAAAALQSSDQPSDPGPDEPELLPYAGPRLWQKVVLTLVCVALGYEILVSALVGTLFVTIGP
ncbi:hypothetical protein ACFV06_32040 [Streptomyces sp. NPDC059618]|uniref:hypothetical protein n=1 Tax=Streptomyces sp. NPDC059618 TaxID=3346887 RepID=UPI00369193C0